MAINADHVKIPENGQGRHLDPQELLWLERTKVAPQEWTVIHQCPLLYALMMYAGKCRVEVTYQMEALCLVAEGMVRARLVAAAVVVVK